MRTWKGSRIGSDEGAVIARVRAGEREAYADLVRAHTVIAHRTAVLLGAGADAEDVVQTAFLKAYQSLGRFREGASFRPWLLRIVANETRNTVRSARRHRTAVLRQAALAEAEPLIPESADPAAAAVAGERRSRLLTALDELSDEHRRVVTHRYLLDLGEAETAEALGWPRGTVKSRLNRALRRLEQLLGADGLGAVGVGAGGVEAIGATVGGGAAGGTAAIGGAVGAVGGRRPGAGRRLVGEGRRTVGQGRPGGAGRPGAGRRPGGAGRPGAGRRPGGAGPPGARGARVVGWCR